MSLRFSLSAVAYLLPSLLLHSFSRMTSGTIVFGSREGSMKKETERPHSASGMPLFILERLSDVCYTNSSNNGNANLSMKM